MAKKNAGDILTCDWNPIIGCKRYSAGCENCWYLDGIFPWQQRLGNIPLDVSPNSVYTFSKRLTVESLRAKKGIVGVVQHGDLFWDRVPEALIRKVLSIIDATVMEAERKRGGVIPKYVLWTKRAQRMAWVLQGHYPNGIPSYIASAVTVENQTTADDRLPHLNRISGSRIIVVEPMLGPVSLKKYLPASWVVVGSETGNNPRPIQLDWVRAIRDEALNAGTPFFIKQLGTSHKDQVRELDGVEWSQFPMGFRK